jgi:hypothetical protein
VRTCHKEVGFVNVNENDIVCETQNIPRFSWNDDETEGVASFTNVDTSNTRASNWLGI